MKILVLKGSANAQGSSAMLADAFTAGAQKVGHEVECIDVTRANVHPCLGCVRCGYEGPCAQHDGMSRIPLMLRFRINTCAVL